MRNVHFSGLRKGCYVQNGIRRIYSLCKSTNISLRLQIHINEKEYVRLEVDCIGESMDTGDHLGNVRLGPLFYQNAFDPGGDLRVTGDHCGLWVIATGNDDRCGPQWCGVLSQSSRGGRYLLALSRGLDSRTASEWSEDGKRGGVSVLEDGLNDIWACISCRIR